MTRQKNISSIESEIIGSNKAQDAFDMPSAPIFHPSKKDISSFWERLLFFKGRIVIGVNIGYKVVSFVKICHISEQKQQLLGFQTFPIPSGLSRKDENFFEFLSIPLKTFCGSNYSDIWLVTQMETENIQYVSIPKASKNESINKIWRAFKKKHSAFQNNLGTKQDDLKEKPVLFDFEIIDEKLSAFEERTEAVAYIVSQSETDHYISMFCQIGLSLTGITFYPFAIQNLLKSYPNVTNGNDVCCLYVGIDRSRIDIFTEKGNLIISRQVKVSVNSMIEAIQSQIKKISTTGISKPEAKEILFALLHNNLSINKKNLTASDIKKMIAEPMKRLLWQVERTIYHYSFDIRKKKIKRIYVFGLFSGYKDFYKHIQENIDDSMEVWNMDPFVKNLISPQDALLPGDVPERAAFASAMGVALSKNFFTPNFVFTYKEKKQFKTLSTINRSVYICFLVLTFLFFGLYNWQNNELQKKRIEETQLQAKFRQLIEKDGMYVDRYVIDSLGDHVNKIGKEIRLYAQKNLSIALINTIVQTTPPNIYLTRLEAQLIPPDTNKSSKNELLNKRQVVLEGIIQDESLLLQQDLMRYFSKIKDSLLFHHVKIQHRSEQKMGDKIVLRFILHLDM